MNPCKLCSCPDRALIEQKIASKELTRSAAAKVANCNVSSVSRHVKNHLAKHVAELTMPEALRVETINVVNELERSTKRLD